MTQEKLPSQQCNVLKTWGVGTSTRYPIRNLSWAFLAEDKDIHSLQVRTKTRLLQRLYKLNWRFHRCCEMVSGPGALLDQRCLRYATWLLLHSHDHGSVKQYDSNMDAFKKRLKPMPACCSTHLLNVSTHQMVPKTIVKLTVCLKGHRY